MDDMFRSRRPSSSWRLFIFIFNLSKRNGMENIKFNYMYRTVVTICTAQWSLYVPHSGHYMYRTVVTICIANLTFSNSTFCPHSVFMCFVWISEQTAIISLYNINWLVCITETECVYCAVRPGPTNCSTVCATPHFLPAEHAISQPSLCHHTCTVQLSTVLVIAVWWNLYVGVVLHSSRN